MKLTLDIAVLPILPIYRVKDRNGKDVLVVVKKRRKFSIDA